MQSSLRKKLSVLAQRRLEVERRGSKRFAPTHRTLCTLQASGDDACAVGLVHNLSYKGVAVQSERAYPLGTHVRVLLINEAHTFSLAAEMVVVRAQRLANNYHLLAGPLVRALSHADMVPFIV